MRRRGTKQQTASSKKADRGGKTGTKSKEQSGEWDSTDRICLGIGLCSVLGIVLVLIGMQTGYTPCWFAKEYSIDLSCNH